MTNAPLTKEEVSALLQDIDKVSRTVYQLEAVFLRDGVSYRIPNDPFFLFWIREKEGRHLFTARRTYQKRRQDNRISLLLSEENRELILSAIDHIYGDYLNSQYGPAPDNPPSLSPSTEAELSPKEIAINQLNVALNLLREHLVEVSPRRITREMVGTRAYHILGRAKAQHEAELVLLNAYELARYSGCGAKTLEDITEYILSRVLFAPKDKDSTSEQEPQEIPPSHIERLQALKDALVAQAKEGIHYERGDDEALWQISESIHSICTDLLPQLKSPSITERHFEIFYRYLSTDTETLRSIGEEYALSRERVRQIYNKVGKRLISAVRKLYHRKIVEPFFSRLCDCLDTAVKMGVSPLLIWTLPSMNGRQRVFFSSLLLGKTFYQTELQGVIEAYVAEKKEVEAESKREKNKRTGAKERAEARWEQLRHQVCFPSQNPPKHRPFPPSYEEEIPLRYLARADQFFGEIKDHVPYLKNPDIVYYQSQKTAHRPNYLLQTEAGQVLVLIVPISKFAAGYNIVRYNALHAFCRENGYGYLILEEHFLSIFELKKMPLQPEMVASLNRILEEQKCIFWPDILKLRESYTITTRDIAAYILQNKLDFRPMTLYRISKRRS